MAHFDLNRCHNPDKAEVSAKLQHEIFHAVEQSTVEVVFGMLLWQPQKLDGIIGVRQEVGGRVASL